MLKFNVMSVNQSNSMKVLPESSRPVGVCLTALPSSRPRFLSAIILCLIGTVSSLDFAVADPLVDKFDGERRAVDRAETTHMEIEAGRLVVTARETEPGVWGKYGNQAIFGWNQEGAREFEGFSIKPADGQFMLQVKNMEKATAANKTDSTGLNVYIYFYVYGSKTRLEESGEIPHAAVPASGSWSFDVRAFAAGRFGGEEKIPENLVWRPEFYISTQNQEGVGYSFESIGAVGSQD